MNFQSPSAGAAAAAGFLAGLAITWGVLGDVSEGVRAYNDPPILGLPNSTGGVQVASVVIGVVFGLASLVAIVTTERARRRFTVRLTCVLTAFGAFLGMAARIVSSRTEGANIGGGLLYITPVVTAGVVIYCIVAVRRRTHQ